MVKVKSHSKIRKRAGAGERRGGGIFPAATAPFAKSRASYFRFARLILSESLAQATIHIA